LVEGELAADTEADLQWLRSGVCVLPWLEVLHGCDALHAALRLADVPSAGAAQGIPSKKSACRIGRNRAISAI
jgi:hypothetical protein